MLKTMEEAKRQAAYAACQKIKENMVVGLGTGSTAYFAIEKCAELYKSGLKITCVGSSKSTEKVATQFGLPLVSVTEVEKLDLYIDGVDEIDPYFNAIKGGGAALLREKILATMAEEVIWIMDDSKQVKTLGKFPLPLEIVPFAASKILRQLSELQLKPVLRLKDKASATLNLAEQIELLKKVFTQADNSLISSPFLVTDNGNLIIDLHFGTNLPLSYLNDYLNNLVGLVEHGLFINVCKEAYIASAGKDVLKIENKAYLLKNFR